jgi:hypothetical protein
VPESVTPRSAWPSKCDWNGGIPLPLGVCVMSSFSNPSVNKPVTDTVPSQHASPDQVPVPETTSPCADRWRLGVEDPYILRERQFALVKLPSPPPRSQSKAAFARRRLAPADAGPTYAAS